MLTQRVLSVQIVDIWEAYRRLTANRLYFSPVNGYQAEPPGLSRLSVE